MTVAELLQEATREDVDQYSIALSIGVETLRMLHVSSGDNEDAIAAVGAAIMDCVLRSRRHKPMRRIYAQVRAFMQLSHPQYVVDAPRFPVGGVLEFCMETLFESERREMYKALVNEDLAEFADAIADLIFVLLFTAAACGLPMDEIWDEVVKTNMAKFEGEIKRDPQTGKILKPEGWKPPDIEAILAKHRK